MKIPREKRFWNDKRYTDYDFSDECWSSTPGASWNGGDSYYCRYYCRVPKKMLEEAKLKGNFRKLDDWICDHNDRGIWY